MICAVEITRGPNKGRLATGTNAGHMRHRRAGESACDACRAARQAYGRTYREANYEELAEKQRVWHETNPDYNRAYYETNREYFQAYYQANQEKYAEWQRARLQANPELGRAAARRRRARLRGVESEDYTLTEVYERDRGLCQLCRRMVNVKLEAPDNRSASIDHIIPLAHGGPDTRVNVQLAHLGCNKAKQDGTIPTGEQLRLVG